MIATTPIGTETFLIKSPSSRLYSLKTSLSGSGSEATFFIEAAISAIRCSVRRSLSSITSDILPFAASKSLAFSLKIISALSKSASAIAQTAFERISSGKAQTAVLALFAFIKICCVVSIKSLLSDKTGSDAFALNNVVEL